MSSNNNLVGKPLVNAWTECGRLEVCVIGAVHDNDCLNEPEPNMNQGIYCDPFASQMINYPVGPRHKNRIRFAREQLQNLREILEGECIQVKSGEQFDSDTRLNVKIQKSQVLTEHSREEERKDTRIKNKIMVLQPETMDPRQYIKTPFWDSYYTYGFGNPRDTLICLGNTLLEASMSH